MTIAALLLIAAQLETFRIYGHVFTLVGSEEACVEAFSVGYLKQRSIEVKTSEIEAIRKMIPANSNISWARPIDSLLKAQASIYKTQRAIYRKHRGRVALAFSGMDSPIAIDAMVTEMKQLEESGQIAFDSASIREAVFQRLQNIRGAGNAEGKAADAAFAHAALGR